MGCYRTRMRKSYRGAFILITLLILAPALVLAAETEKKDNQASVAEGARTITILYTGSVKGTIDPCAT